MNPKITDGQILKGIADFRRHEKVRGLAGPESLEELGAFLAWNDAAIERPVAKGTLSPRLWRLVERGLLGVRSEGPWWDGGAGRLFTAGLYVTERGRQYLEKGDGRESL